MSGEELVIKRAKRIFCTTQNTHAQSYKFSHPHPLHIPPTGSK